jgi:hypothetical protein
MSKQRAWCGLFCSLLALVGTTPAAEPGEVVFQDDFVGKLSEGWSWEREDRATWRVGSSGLEVRVQPGNMWGAANNARNVLLRPIPTPADAPVEISVTLSNVPTAQWEQANLVWFYDDGHMVKLGQELVTGRFSIVMGREENDRARTVAIIPLDDYTVELRLQAVRNRVRGQFRNRPWSEWREVGECDLPVKGEPQASLQFYNGPPREEHWIRVSRFVVRRLKPEAATWPRQRASENTYRVTGSGPTGSGIATLRLGDGGLVLARDAQPLVGATKADGEQRIFLHQDGSCGWSWDRRSSSSREPILAGIGLGDFDARARSDTRFPWAGTVGANKRTLALESDAVTRLENDHGDHTLAARIWLTTSQAGGPPTHRISIQFDWYGKEAASQSLHDGYRGYEYVETKSSPDPGADHFQYRIQGFRGAPPKVNLQAFVGDAVKRGLPENATIVGLWFGNEVWDGSRGGTLVTRLDYVLDGKRNSAVSAPSAAPGTK